jgi:hypothetical protein
MKKRLIIVLSVFALTFAAAASAAAGGPADKVLGNVFFEDEGGVLYQMRLTAFEGEPAEGVLRLDRLDGSGWSHQMDVQDADVQSNAAVVSGVTPLGNIWLFWIIDGGRAAKNGDELTWIDPWAFEGEATMVAGNLKVLDHANGQ